MVQGSSIYPEIIEQVRKVTANYARGDRPRQQHTHEHVPGNNPKAAMWDYLKNHPEFDIDKSNEQAPDRRGSRWIFAALQLR